MKRRFIDLRSDTVTKPTPEMRQAMANAEVGDDVFGEDPTVQRLQSTVAEMLGKMAALYVPSGVMANQLAIKVLTKPGEEIIVERDSHIFHYENAAPSVLSQVQLHTVGSQRGVFSVDELERHIRPKEYYFPRTSVICLENTHNRAGGVVYPLSRIKEISKLAGKHDLRMHLDGARLWNASVAAGISPAEFAKHFDTVSVCFSKGLGAPVGSAIVGTREMIDQARKYRKLFGGGMRQAGILAAGALYALEHHLQRLVEDHRRARQFAEQVGALPGLTIDMESVQTNIVIIDVSKTKKTPGTILKKLRSKNVLLTESGPSSIRAVMHLDISDNDLDEAITVFQSIFR